MTTQLDHITNEEIEQDILDTENEITTMQREIEGFRILGDRLSHFKADARRDGIAQRQEFITKLRGILAGRSKP
jgi:hypothetical protein